MESKYEHLLDMLRAHGPAAVAFSGGVDSALLLHAAHEALGDDVLAISVDSPLFPQRELSEAREFCAQRGIRHIVVPVNELENAEFRANAPDRCYTCKSHLLGAIFDTARQNGLETVLEGSNVDDEADYRPGSRAVAELGALSPLKDAGLTKKEIRCLSRAFGLPTWDKQSFACLATRFAFGDLITEERVRRVGKAEQVLLDLGLGQVRVRDHGTHARIEVAAQDVARLAQEPLRSDVVSQIEALGFPRVEIDPRGYQGGSMNAR